MKTWASMRAGCGLSEALHKSLRFIANLDEDTQAPEAPTVSGGRGLRKTEIRSDDDELPAVARLPELDLGELRWLHPELRSSSHWAHRWRETDSNHRFLVQETGRFGGNANTFEGRRR